MKVVTAAEMRSIEEAAVKRGTPLDVLMQRAGGAVADRAGEICGGGTILILVGPGNNGGDGLVAARALQAKGFPVAVHTFHRPDLGGFDGHVVRAEDDPGQSALGFLAAGSSVVVDALLGIGQTRQIEGLLAAIVTCVNTRRRPGAGCLAVDIPTGVDTDSGAVMGAAVRASETLAMGYLKRGQVLYPGAEYTGRVRAIDIGFASDLAADVRVTAPTDAEIAQLLPVRSLESNKGTYGRLLLVGGCRTFLGAPAMSCLAAYRTGAGLVEVAVTEKVQQSVAAHALEPIFAPLPEREGHIAAEAMEVIEASLQRATALVFGPGMGLTGETIEVTRRVLDLLPAAKIHGAVVDADGLNALSRLPDWWRREAPLVLTPHPGEMGRLTGLGTAEVQRDRIGVARRYAAEWGTVVVLKGAGTVVASPSGDVSINRTGGPNLATAGTGDVLSGTIGGFLAQGCKPFDAAVAGVYLHGRAGDLLRVEHGDAGTVAGDLIPMLPAARLSILQERGDPV